jgi:predicted MFS family arabinose efflux permease
LGVKPVLLLSFCASALSYSAVAYAGMRHSLWLLFVAQVPTVLQHAVIAARAYVVKTEPAERTQQLFGYLGLAYGAGFVVGPALGGWIAQTDLTLTAVLAAGISLLSIASIAAFLPASAGAATPGASADAALAAGAAPTSGMLAGYKHIYRAPTLRWLFSLKFCASMSLAIFHSVFALVAKERFGMQPADTGLLMSLVGVVGMLTQAFLSPFLATAASERRILLGSAAGLAASCVALSFVTTKTALAAVCIPITVASGIFSLLNSSQIARASPAAVKGTIVASDMALFSGVRMLTPTLAAYLLHEYGYWTVGASSGAFMALAAALIAAGAVHFDAQTYVNPRHAKKQH